MTYCFAVFVVLLAFGSDYYFLVEAFCSFSSEYDLLWLCIFCVRKEFEQIFL